MSSAAVLLLDIVKLGIPGFTRALDANNESKTAQAVFMAK
jgi:hypothetical protein